MKQFSLYVLGAAVGFSLTGQAQAFTLKGTTRSVSVSASGVAESATLDPVIVVVQGTADTPATLGFGTGNPNDLVDSEKSLRINVTTNVAGNRVIIFTNNLSATANPPPNPTFCDDTAKGIDGGGLVGVGTPDNCKRTVPVIWAVADTNVDYVFARHDSPPPALGADNGVFMTDRAHVRTFTGKSSALDNVATKFCDAAATHAVPPTNTTGDGLYPQYFGDVGKNLDICRISDGTKIVEAEELSKNIAVVAFGFSGTAGFAANLATASTEDTINVTSPFYVPMAADFRGASGNVLFGPNKLFVDLVAQ